MPILKNNKEKNTYNKEFGDLHEQRDIIYLCIKHYINRNYDVSECEN